MQPNQLMEHPEGGRFQEVFRSPVIIQRSDGAERHAMTHIYFELQPHEVSRFHRVQADEVWNLYRGQGVRLHLWDGTETPPQCHEISAAQQNYCHVVPAGIWQAAEPMDDTVLVGCSVGPGFEFQDFDMLDPASSQAETLRNCFPDKEKFIPTA